MDSDPLRGISTRRATTSEGEGRPPVLRSAGQMSSAKQRRAGKTVRERASLAVENERGVGNDSERGTDSDVTEFRAGGVSDPLAARAAELHAKALEADALAARYRAERDSIIDRLREVEPKRWSYTALAHALGCSRELIAQIVRRRR